MIFKSRSLNNDPKPWARFPDGDGGVRLAKNVTGHLYWHPRPEFTPTRDPQPWIDPLGTRWEMRPPEGWAAKWAPRSEFDNPVNLILVELRADYRNGMELHHLAREIRRLDEPLAYGDMSPGQIEHARKVLTRLLVQQVSS